MADINVEKRGARPNFAWGWIGLGILLLGVLIWFVYSFIAMGTGPEPASVDFERVSPQPTAPAQPSPTQTAPGQTPQGQTAPGQTAPGQTAPGQTPTTQPPPGQNP